MKYTTIIAEAGVNHNGSIELAKQLIDAAAAAGVDYVKFQTFKAKALISKSAAKADYQSENTNNAQETQLEMVQKLELSFEQHHELIAYCKEKGIRFSSTGFDFESMEFLDSLNLDFFKIPSGEITNLPYLRKAATYDRKLIMSTGMATMDEVREALNVLLKSGADKKNITVLHCNTMYPTPMQDVNLQAMNTIGQELDVAIGYSDHTLGIEVPIAATALGATIIEKHFTLDRTLPGPDHAASLEPQELAAMVAGIRNIDIAMGSTLKVPSPSEMANINVARKSIVASTPIKKGQQFSLENCGFKRPGTGLSPMRWDEVNGVIATRDYEVDDQITLDA